MGWLGSGLAGLIGGYEEGRQAKYDRQQQRQALALQQQQQAADNAYRQQSLTADQQYRQQQQANADRTYAADNRIAGLGPDGQPLPPLPVPRALSRYMADPAAEAARNAHLATYYASHGRPDLAKQYNDAAMQIGLGAQRAATANLDATRGQEILKGRIPEEQARANYYRGKLGVDLQVARARIAAAQGAAQARVQAAQIAASASIQRAGISAQGQEDARIIAGYLALQGDNVRSATQTAIAQAQGAERYAAAMNQPRPATDLAAPNPVPVPNFTVPISVNTQPTDLGSIVRAIAPYLNRQPGVVPITNTNTKPPGNTKQPPGGGGLTPAQAKTANDTVVDARAQIAKDPQSAATIRAHLESIIASDPTNAPAAREAIRQLFPGKPALFPVAPTPAPHYMRGALVP